MELGFIGGDGLHELAHFLVQTDDFIGLGFYQRRLGFAGRQIPEGSQGLAVVGVHSGDILSVGFGEITVQIFRFEYDFRAHQSSFDWCGFSSMDYRLMKADESTAA
jgi:hypothetical protein